MKEKLHTIYCIENLINSKIYIGMTINLKKRWKAHCAVARGGPETYSNVYSYIHKAINKYGVENFNIFPMQYCDDDAHMKEMEKYWIMELRRLNIKNYNLTDGGDGTSGYACTKEQRQAMSRRMKGKFTGDKNPFYNQKHTQDTKNFLSDKMKRRHSDKEFVGENHSHSKLTDEIVIGIKTDFYINKLTKREISSKYDVKIKTIIDPILREKVWCHIQIKIPSDLSKDKERSREHQSYFDNKFGKKIIHHLCCALCKIDFIVEKRELSKKIFPKFCGNKCKLLSFSKSSS